MRATLWSDYLCPWCYLGQHRDDLLADLGVPVVQMPYELHPGIPPEGRRLRPDGRLAPTFERVEQECAELGMPFRRPERMPNTRRALETAEWVRRHHPTAFDAVHRGFFAAQFVTGHPLDDPEVLDAVVEDAGAPAAQVRAAVDAGEARPLVDDSMQAAREIGVTSTPSWAIDSLVIPGVFDPATFRRWISKMQSRQAPATG